MSEKKNVQIRALQEKSEQALSDAELLLENSSVEATVNRGYYAVFQVARAALLTKEESPNTHSGVIRRFGYHFVRTGQVPDEVGDTLTTAQSTGGRADYDAPADLDQEDAANLVDDARRFLEVIREQVLPSR
ncbi:hypothetical protein GGP84_002968 [Salinibacter ruber]|uniref:HEPN domain-containing protein n=1 Tax=Salinibacter ruber TaxID=146919 RepID=UPI002167FA73|nr:hypothetical protein [Salinibacter ruber]